MNPRILSAGIIPVIKKSDRWFFLILRCFNYWDFPKGEIDGSEIALDAAIRELAEETGITETMILFDEAFIETEPYAKNKVARYYIGEVSIQKVQLLPNPENGMIEHHEYKWLEYNEARKLMGTRLQKVLDWANEKLNNE